MYSHTNQIALDPSVDLSFCLLQKSLLSGVFSLIKLCSEEDIAFVKASLDETARESFQTILAEYIKFYKFSGRV